MRNAWSAGLVTALMSLFAVASSTAGAVTWHNTGNTAFTATGGAATLSANGLTIACGSVDVTGTSPALTTTNDLATLTARFTNCTVASIFNPHMLCSVTLTGIAQDGTTVTDAGDFRCVMTITGSSPCTITGQVPGAYVNPSDPTPGALRLPHSAGGLTVSGPGCLFAGSGTLSAQIWRVANGTGGAGTLGPIITRTA